MRRELKKQERRHQALKSVSLVIIQRLTYPP